MLRFSRLLPLLFLAGFAAPCHAALIQTFDLKTLCFLSTDVVEARLERHHLPGQPEWNDRFTATVLNPLEGRFHAGDQIKGLDLSLYDPARTEQHCILFLAPNTVFLPTPPKDAPLRTVDMMLIDSHNRVRRYFQQSDPGGLIAEGFTRISLPPTLKRTIIHRHNATASLYQENSTFAENVAAEQKYPTLAEERLLITSRWAGIKKLKAPPYQVLHR
jgi:hypothetical protein